MSQEFVHLHLHTEFSRQVEGRDSLGQGYGFWIHALETRGHLGLLAFWQAFSLAALAVCPDPPSLYQD